MDRIEVRELSRSFGELQAVSGISFSVRQGEIFGFLGPNGAGKTTTINMLCTLLKPDGGEARIGGFDIRTQPAQVRRSIGVIFQDASLDEQLTGRENLRFHAMLYDLNREQFEDRARMLLAMVELAEKADDLVATYSGGMKRRLEIARGLLHQPGVLFLDEPTLGLDPQTRRHIWGYLRRLRDEQGVTMFMTSHYMEEAENCDRIAIIDHGSIVSLDTPEKLKALVGGDVVAFRTRDGSHAQEILEREHGLQARPGPDGQLILEIPSGEQFIPRMIATLGDAGEPVESVSLRRPTLEDVFIKLTGRAIREQEADSAERMRMRRRMGRRSR